MKNRYLFGSLKGAPWKLISVWWTHKEGSWKIGICSVNRPPLPRKFVSVRRTDKPSWKISRSTFFCYQTDNDSPGRLFRISTNTDTDFPGAPLLSIATEQIRIFQEAFFQSQGTDRQFPGRYSPQVSPLNRYFSNRSRWLLSITVLKYV